MGNIGDKVLLQLIPAFLLHILLDKLLAVSLNLPQVLLELLRYQVQALGKAGGFFVFRIFVGMNAEVLRGNFLSYKSKAFNGPGEVFGYSPYAKEAQQ